MSTNTKTITAKEVAQAILDLRKEHNEPSGELVATLQGIKMLAGCLYHEAKQLIADNESGRYAKEAQRIEKHLAYLREERRKIHRMEDVGIDRLLAWNSRELRDAEASLERTKAMILNF